MVLTTTPPPPKSGQVTTGPPVSPAKARLGWLDALRGIAALTVMVSHYIEFMLPQAWTVLGRYFVPGTFGVLLFFMVSGYIIPASLERRGSVRGFWLSRLFRLYPLTLVSIGLGLLFVGLGWQTRSLAAITPALAQHPTTTVLANATMLQDLLGGANMVPVMWTLSYEMVFYCLVSALFAAGLHRRSGQISLGFAGLALLSLAVVPPLCFSTSYPGSRVAILVSFGVFVVGIGCMVSRRVPRAVGAVLVGGLVLTLVVLNGRLAPWYSMVILATMFSGTALYRAEQGQVSRRVTAALCIPVVLISVAIGTRYGGDRSGAVSATISWPWVFGILAVWGLFTAGMLLRNRAMPGPLSWLGRISFSVYMLHVVMLSAVLWLMRRLHVVPLHLQLWEQLLWLLGPCAVVLAVSQLTYQYVEMPMQRLGRRVSERADRRWGSDVRP